MVPKSRAKRCQEVQDLTESPEPAKTRQPKPSTAKQPQTPAAAKQPQTPVKQHQTPPPKEPESPASSQDTQDTLAPLAGSMTLELDPELFFESHVTVAIKKRGRGHDDAAREAKKPRILTIPQGPVDARHGFSALQRELDAKVSEVKEANDRASELQVEAESAKTDLKSRLKECRKLQAQLDDEETQQADLKKRLKKLENENAALRKEAKITKAELGAQMGVAEEWQEKYFTVLDDRRPDYGDPDKVTDDEICSRWQHMVGLVNNVANASTDTPPGKCEASLKNTSIEGLVAECNKYPQLAHCLVKRFVWRRLCSDVFKAKNGVWGGRMGEFLVKTVAKLRYDEVDNPMNLSIISRMKFRTAKDIDSDIGVNTEALEKLSAKLAADVSPLVSGPKHQSVQVVMKKLFKQAAEFMVIITRSRSIFDLDVDGLERDCDPHHFDPETMEKDFSNHWDGPDDEQVVDLTMTPSLHKIGTADGANFDSGFFICKAAVATHRKITTPE